jgi:hypothetical protein
MLVAKPEEDVFKGSSTTHRWTCILLISATLCQKIAIPGTGSSDTAIPISLPILLIAICFLLLQGKLVIDVWRIITFFAFLVSTIVSLVFSQSSYLSVTSWLYLLVVQAAFIFRFTDFSFDFRRTMNFLSNLALFCALMGILQFVIQFVLGSTWAFPIENFVPRGLLLSGFNNIIPIVWNSPILKSNGFFFAEPSFFCQFLAIGMIVELIKGFRLVRISIITVAILLSFSGTGLMTLGLFLPWYIISKKRYDIAALGAIAAIVVITQASSLNLSALTDRASEFSNTDSSGFGRFLSIFYVIDRFILIDLPTALFGRGPGTVTEFFKRMEFGAFDPTWGKIFYEYGIIGFSLYFCFFLNSFVLSRNELRVPLGFTFLFLGGYVANSFVVIPMLVLVSWPRASVALGIRQGSTGIRMPTSPFDPHALAVASPPTANASIGKANLSSAFRRRTPRVASFPSTKDPLENL